MLEYYKILRKSFLRFAQTLPKNVHICHNTKGHRNFFHYRLSIYLSTYLSIQLYTIYIHTLTHPSNHPLTHPHTPTHTHTHTHIHIYLYIYIYIYILFTPLKDFLEVTIESWPEWDFNPKPLNSVQARYNRMSY